MPKKLTITGEAEVYDGLHRVIERRPISGSLNDLARPHVTDLHLAGSFARPWPFGAPRPATWPAWRGRSLFSSASEEEVRLGPRPPCAAGDHGGA